MPEKVPGKGIGQGMWGRQSLKKNIHCLVSCSHVHSAPYKFLLTSYWWLEGVQALLKLSGKELRGPWVCSRRQSSQGIEVGWEEELLQVGSNRNKEKSGETEIKERGGPSSLT